MKTSELKTLAERKIKAPRPLMSLAPLEPRELTLNPSIVLELLVRLEAMEKALNAILIKVDWNADDFELNQYQETREIIVNALSRHGSRVPLGSGGCHD